MAATDILFENGTLLSIHIISNHDSPYKCGDMITGLAVWEPSATSSITRTPAFPSDGFSAVVVTTEAIGQVPAETIIGTMIFFPRPGPKGPTFRLHFEFNFMGIVTDGAPWLDVHPFPYMDGGEVIPPSKSPDGRKYNFTVEAIIHTKFFTLNLQAGDTRGLRFTDEKPFEARVQEAAAERLATIEGHDRIEPGVRFLDQDDIQALQQPQTPAQHQSLTRHEALARIAARHLAKAQWLALSQGRRTPEAEGEPASEDAEEVVIHLKIVADQAEKFSL